jgi:uncharacterized protein (DUF885 family)
MSVTAVSRSVTAFRRSALAVAMAFALGTAVVPTSAAAAGAEAAATAAAASAPAAATRAGADDARATPAAALQQLVEAYWQARLELNPLLATSLGDSRWNHVLPIAISPEHRARSLATERRFLEQARAIRPEQLQGQDRLTWEIFVRGREQAIEGFRYPEHLLPVDQFNGLPQSLAQLGSGTGIQPFVTVRDYEAWLQRAGGFPAWVDQAIANMREGVKLGVVQPRPLIEKLLPQLDQLAPADVEKSVFWQPVARMPESFPAADRERLTNEYRTAIGQTLLPAYRRLAAFLRDEYLPKTRDSIALTALPDGRDWYAYRVRQMTTTNHSPERIHEIGLAEVARIGAEMDRVIAQVGFRPPAEAKTPAAVRKAFIESIRSNPKFYFEREEDLLNGYRALKAGVLANAPKLFSLVPQADFEIRAVEPFRAPAAANGSYQRASPDGKRPGIFYANTYDLKSRPKYLMQPLFLHEAIPGHHFQIALAQELGELPSFRRFGGYTAFSEGWALYAESLGRELGLYTDPYDYFGSLSSEIFRAVRLVVDTGMQVKGWTRQQALEYILTNSAYGETGARAEVDRYLAMPGQALAYKMGELQITELKRRAQQELGAKFDVRDFHREVLMDGALPLDVLAAKVDRWIAATKGTAARAAKQ